MPRYHRILVKYRLANSQEWSNLHWCDIESTDASALQVRTAPIDLHKGMPNEASFINLAPEEAKKLLVIDFSEPTIIGSSSSDYVMYCLVVKNKEMYRFEFSTYYLFNSPGRRWIKAELFDIDNSLPLKQCFEQQEMGSDPRLDMRRNSTEYHYDIINSESVDIIAVLKGQYSAMQIWQNDRKKPLTIELNLVKGSLADNDRLIVHTPLCNALSAIKRMCLSAEEYQRSLTIILTNQPITGNVSSEWAGEMLYFRDSMLRHSDYLTNLFDKDYSTHPSLTAVREYIFELVLLELRSYDPNNQLHVPSSPATYDDIHLGRSQDEIYAFLLNNSFFQERINAPVPPANRAQPLRLWLLVLGASLCAFGSYLVFSHVLTGAALIVVGILCILATKVSMQNNPGSDLYLDVNNPLNFSRR